MPPRKPPQSGALDSSQQLQAALAEIVELKTKNAIEEALSGLRADIALLKPALTRIEEQTTKTNGRVGDLEKWQAKSTGVMAAVSAMASLIGYGISQIIAFFR